jgi:hypothetical protein
MEEKLENVTETKEMDFGALRDKCKLESKGKEDKAPQLDVKDLGKKCEIYKSYELPSKFEDGNPTYTAALLKMEDGTQRWKSISSWDRQEIAKAKNNKFVVSSIVHKGSIKLTLKAESTDGLVAGI